MTPSINLNITVSTPEAAIALIQALNTPCEKQVTHVSMPMPPAAAAVAAAVHAAVPYVEAPVSMPAPAANPIIPQQAVIAPVTGVPAAGGANAQTAPLPTAPVPTSAPVYSFDDLARAAGPLMDAGKTADLQALLRSFNVQALTQLPKEQYGVFATALRGLGARI